MSFADELAAFRLAHPDIGWAEAFTVDLNGIPRGKMIPIGLLEKLAEGSMKLPSATMALDVFSDDVYGTGLAIQTGDPDGPLVPIEGTLAPMLWADPPCAQVQVEVRLPDGALAEYCPVHVLRQVTDSARQRGLTPVLAMEQEFFLTDPVKPLAPYNPLTGARLEADQVFDMDVSRAFAQIMTEIAEASTALGAPTETLVTEFGFGQFETNLIHVDDPLQAAGQIVALRRAIRGIARKHEMDVTFMAKPYGETVGSGLHLHLSLWDGDQNVFDAGDAEGPNDAVRHAIGGCLAHIADAMLIFAPHLNSYRRFIPGNIAPVEALWALDHRGTALRVPETHGKGARIEHRVAGSDANPYLVAAAILASALAGLDGKVDPSDPVRGEVKSGMGERLPKDWVGAEQLFSDSEFVKNWLGAPFQHAFAAIKQQEWTKLLGRITDVEREAYWRRL
jgi:glutamine synthetase